MVSLVFGLPLLTAYYNVNPSFYLSVLIPYVVITMSLSAIFILRSQFSSRFESESSRSNEWTGPTQKQIASTAISKFNSLPRILPIGLIGLTVLIFTLAASIAMSAYPTVLPLETIDYLGAAYIIPLIATSIIVFSRLIYRSFPVLRDVLSIRKYSILSVALALGFCFVYFILVNQIIISGYNVEGTAPALEGASPAYVGYPSWFAMAPGVNNILIYLVYLPTLIVQISPAVNLIIIPFEMVFATLLSLLVASNIVMAHYLISHSGFRCSTRGAALSTGGSILGLSATCPTCLVPTFVSVAFGGVTASVLSFSSLYGVILPPVLSIFALVLSAIYLQREIKKRVFVDSIQRV